MTASASGAKSPQTPDSGALPLRVLCVLANPADLPRFDAERTWSEIDEALHPFQKRGSVLYERLAEPTESALKKTLAQGNWSVLHLVVHAEERSSANYGTIALQASDGNARKLTAPYIAAMLAAVPSLKLAILQDCGDAKSSFDIVARTLLDQRLPCIAVVPALYGKSLQLFLAKLYAGLLMGLSADEVSNELRTALGVEAPRILSGDGSSPIFAMKTAAPEVAAAGAEQPSSTVPATAEPPWHEVIRQRRAAGVFDVFMCHNGADKPEVKRIALQLKEAGILPWLDVWELPPGQPWQPLLEQQIGSIKSAAVCFGSAGIGPWQEREMYALLSEFVERNVPVIPLLLPDAPLVPELPRFLRGMTWVDFRCDDPNPLLQLIWGITGKRPGD